MFKILYYLFNACSIIEIFILNRQQFIINSGLIIKKNVQPRFILIRNKSTLPYVI